MQNLEDVEYVRSKRETFYLVNVPKKHTFTWDGSSVVFYEDTERGEAKSYHSYMRGKLYMSKAFPEIGKEYYCCDIYGNYIPRSYIDEITRLKKEVKELSVPVFKTELKTFIG